MTNFFRVLTLIFIVWFPSAVNAQTKEAKPFVLGKIEQIQSVELGEQRTLNVYLPDGYSPDSALRYPVIYLLDGSADEDFIHVAGLVQFCSFPWVNILPKTIVVGIANRDRRRDFTFPTTVEKDKKDFPTTGASAKFIAFVEKEVQPFVDQNYKTNNSKTLVGQSLGGLLATEILFKKPHLFNQYVIVSPSLWWDKESLLVTKRQPLTSSTKVFVAVGKEGKVMESDAKSLFELLKKDQSNLLNALYHYLPDENHATIYHQALYEAFVQLQKAP